MHKTLFWIPNCRIHKKKTINKFYLMFAFCQILIIRFSDYQMLPEYWIYHIIMHDWIIKYFIIIITSSDYETLVEYWMLFN